MGKKMIIISILVIVLAVVLFAVMSTTKNAPSAGVHYFEYIDKAGKPVNEMSKDVADQKIADGHMYYEVTYTEQGATTVYRVSRDEHTLLPVLGEVN